MINLFSGTPGSGKSLHLASMIYWRVRAGKPCICNFDVRIDYIGGKKDKNFTYVSNEKLTPKYLVEYAQKYIDSHGGKVKEGSITLVIDECQLLFNSRDWGQKGRADWLAFFSLHRHYGFDIYLVAQFDRMIDRQIRSLIEYEYIHRKVSNFGIQGKIMSVFAAGRLFVAVKVWYPMNEKVGSEFFVAKKFYYRLYDTYAIFDANAADRAVEDGGPGAPADADGSAPLAVGEA